MFLGANNVDYFFKSDEKCIYFFLQIIILDVRVPCTPVAKLNNHRACVNGIAWAPHSSCHICTAGTFKVNKKLFWLRYLICADIY